MKTLNRSREEMVQFLQSSYKKAKQLEGIPLLPTPPGYTKHSTIQMQLGYETIAPFVAVRGSLLKAGALEGLTQEEMVRLAADPRVCPWVASTASHALSTNAPLIHLTNDLAQAFADTDPSAEPADYRMPFPSFILNLPHQRCCRPPADPAAPQSNPTPQLICLLPCSNRRETPTPPTAGNQMKTITLRIPAVEAAMLQELQKTHKSFRNLEGLVLGLIGDTYRNTSKGKAAK